MIVEDEGLVALQIKDSLESIGYEVPAVLSSGQDAITRTPEVAPDLILMDIHLKGSIDGVEAAAQIRHSLDIPVIYITAFSDDITVERAKDTEPFGYILKPISEKPLQIAIEMALRKANSEKTLKMNQDLYSSILKGIGQGILVADLKGSIKFINRFAENISEWKQEDAAGKRLNEVFVILEPKKKTQVKLPLDEAILDGKIKKMDDFILVTKKKREVAVDFSIAPLCNKFENAIGIVFLFTPRGGSEPAVEPEIEEAKEDKKESLFPQHGKTVGDITCEWLYRKGNASSRDLFDFFPIDKNQVAFYIVDTAGHSYTTNIFLINLHQFLSTDIDRGGILLKRIPQPVLLSPREVVMELNRRFYFDLNDNPFFTLIYGITNLVSGKTRIVRAGHPFPIYQEAGGKLTLIESEGYAIGMFPEIEVAEFDFTFEKHSRLFLYSDGLIDSTFADINQSAFSRLKEFIEKNKKTPLPELINLLNTEERKWHEKMIVPDDIIAFVIERS